MAFGIRSFDEHRTRRAARALIGHGENSDHLGKDSGSDDVAMLSMIGTLSPAPVGKPTVCLDHDTSSGRVHSWLVIGDMYG